MITLREAVIVEGKYDKIRLSGFLDALIIETEGFRIFKNREKLALLRRLARTRGLLILTDSDGAGLLIRNYLSGAISADQIRHAYIPQLRGKEKRKEHPSGEGFLGVEGVDEDTILEAIRKSGVLCETGRAPRENPITKTDFFEMGLSGGKDSAQKRRELQKTLELPENLSANALLRLLNAFMTREDFINLAGEKIREKSAI